MSTLDEKSELFKIEKLRGSENFDSWDLNVSSVLIGKGLDIYIEDSYPDLIDTKHKANSKLAWSILIQTLSSNVQGSLSPTARDRRQANAHVLYSELRKAYAATSGARLANLLFDMFKTTIPEDEEPQIALGKIRLAHTQLINCGESISETILSHAMLMALPSSYNSMRQTLMVKPDLDSDTVLSAVRNEWASRKNQDYDATHSLTTQSRHRTRPKRDPNMYCKEHDIYGSHWTKDCYKLRNKQQTSAAIAQSDVNLQPLDSDNESASFTAVTESSALNTGISTAQLDKINFIIDSGADNHMVNDPNILNDIQTCSPIKVIFGNGSTLMCTTQGTLNIGTARFENALLVPGLKRNLISVSRSPGAWEFKDNTALLKRGTVTILKASKMGGLYCLRVRKANCLTTSTSEDQLMTWHRALGHLNVRDVYRLALQKRINLTNITSNDLTRFQCEFCILGKGKRLPAPPSVARTSKPLALVHIDLWGPSPVASLHQHRFFLTCYDDYTRKVHLHFLKAKSDAIQAIKDYITKVERQIDFKVKQIRSDNGGEFIAGALKTYFNIKGIEHIRVPPAAHAQNGRVERVHLTILNGVRTILAETRLPLKFWDEAANYIAYMRNLSPSGTEHVIPEDLWYGGAISRPYQRLYPFGSKVYYRDHQVTAKVKPRYRNGLLVGYQDGTSNMRIFDLQKEVIVVSRDVVFKAGSDNLSSGGPIRDTQVDNLIKDVDNAIPEVSSFRSLKVDENTDYAHFEIPTVDSAQGSPAVPTAPRIYDTPSTTANSDIGGPRRSQRLATLTASPEPSDDSTSSVDPLDLLNDDSDRSEVNRAFAAAAEVVSVPKTYEQARGSPDWVHWEEAMQKELANMKKYDVGELVLRSQVSKHVLGTRWVYSRKVDGSTGETSAYKARWVAKGFTQIEGLDYTELFASVAHKDSIRVFLALVNYLDLNCDQIDIKAAFLNGDLKEEIYLEPPEGSGIPKTMVIRLKRTLYGLKQAPRCFNEKLNAWLVSQRFKASNVDPCVYIRTSPHLIVLSVHVDDQLIACTSRTALDDFKRLLNSAFECSDGGEADYFLGFNILRNRQHKQLQISQKHYINALLEKYNMQDANSVQTPLPPGFEALPASDDEFKLANKLPFPNLAGSLLYLATISRPDIAHASGMLCRYISKWNTTHFNAAKHMLRYLKGTIDLNLHFEAADKTEAFCDSDWASDKNNRRSTTGYVFKVLGATVAWKSRFQPTIALSTTEAEYMASADCARQAIWLQQLLSDLHINPQLFKPFKMFNDNRGAIDLSKNPVHHERTKHIDIRHHFLREKVAENRITLQHVASLNNPADLLTKYLARDLFKRLRHDINVRTAILRT